MSQSHLAPRSAHNHAPVWLGVPIVIAIAFLLLPFGAMALRVQWHRLPSLLAQPASQDALWLSLRTCLASTALCMVCGIPLALWLARRSDTWLTRTVRTLATLPMVLPPVVAGLALLITWGRMGVVGSHLSLMGIDIGFSTLAVIFAQTFVAMPFLVTSLEGALRTRGFIYEDAAHTLGAGRTRILFHVTLPLSAPAIASSTALAFSRCLGEFGATLTFAGSLQGVTRTLPLEIYLQRENDSDLALALSVTLIAIALLAVGGTALLSKALSHRFVYSTPAEDGAEDATQKSTAMGGIVEGERAGDSLASQGQSEGDTAEGSATGTIVKSSADKATTVATTHRATASTTGIDAKDTSDMIATIGESSKDGTAGEKHLLMSKHSSPSIHVNARVDERHLDMDFLLCAGSTTALLGPNGSGKSSLISLIAGSLLPDSGSITFSTQSPRIVILEQNPALFPHMNVLDNVVFGLTSHGFAKNEARELAYRQLTALSVDHLHHRMPHTLSGGQARRVALARALAITPDIVLLDEPFAALDVEVAEQMRSLLRTHLHGITAVIATHDIADVTALDADVVFIRRGHIANQGHWKNIIPSSDDEFIDKLARTYLLDNLLHTKPSL